MKIFITGGTSGIGKATVEAFSDTHNVTFVGRDEKRGHAIADQTGAKFICADLSRVDECQRVSKEYFDSSLCDVLINNAGMWTEGKIDATPVEEIRDVLEINSISPMVLTSEFVEHMKRSISSGNQESARIIFINSQLGLVARPERAVYAASKWAITGFARSIAIELAPFNIGVTNLCPAYVETEMFDHSGYPREFSNPIQPGDVVDAIRYVIGVPGNVSIAELAVKPTSYA